MLKADKPQDCISSERRALEQAALHNRAKRSRVSLPRRDQHKTYHDQRIPTFPSAAAGLYPSVTHPAGPGTA